MIKIIEYLKLLSTKNKTLTLALIVSLLVHILLLSKFQFKLPEQDEAQQAINVRLVNVQPMQKATSVPTNNASQEPLAPQEQPKPEPEVLRTPNTNSTSADSPKIPMDAPTEISPIPENMQPTEQVFDETATNPSPLKIIAAVATNETSEISESTEIANMAKKSLPKIYNYIETEFEVRRENDDGVAGIARIIFILDKNHTYMLTSMTQTKDLSSQLFTTLTEKSIGAFTDKGLTPNYYSYQYGNDQKRALSARFNWAEYSLQMHSAKGDKIETLNAGTQDILSFMYQFMFTPPLENIEITMTNGTNIGNYSYHFQGEEKITTKLGKLSTIHLLKYSDDEKTELWLSIDHHHLPVKIRKTEKNGSILEQTATNIYTVSP